MTEPSNTMLAERVSRAKAKVQDLIEHGGLTFLSLENALSGLNVMQRLEIKRSLAQAGLLP